jgi:hypothetical protein
MQLPPRKKAVSLRVATSRYESSPYVHVAEQVTAGGTFR